MSQRSSKHILKHECKMRLNTKQTKQKANKTEEHFEKQSSN